MGKKRNFVGRVRGGLEQCAVAPEHFWPAQHAVGRVVAMQEMLINAAYLKSEGKMPASNVSVVGADFQDFRPLRGSGYILAHRAPRTVYVGGQNLAKYAAKSFSEYDTKGDPIQKPTLLHYVVAPQARTTPMPAFGNYGDTYLEQDAEIRVIILFERLLKTQKANRPLEKGALVEELGKLRELLDQAYTAANLHHQDKREEKGHVESGLLDIDDADIEGALPKEDGGGASVVSGRRPTQTDTAPQLYLELCQSAGRTAPEATEATVSDYAAELDEADRST